MEKISITSLFLRTLIISVIFMLILCSFILLKDRNAFKQDYLDIEKTRIIQATASYYSDIISAVLISEMQTIGALFEQVKIDEGLNSINIVTKPAQFNASTSGCNFVGLEYSSILQIPTCFKITGSKIIAVQEISSGGAILGYLIKTKFIRYPISLQVKRYLQNGLLLLLYVILFGLVYILQLRKKLVTPLKHLAKDAKKILSKTEAEKYKLVELQLLANALAEAHSDLILQSHLASIGQTASMLAHDLRRPFANMKVFLDMLPAKKDDDEFIRRSVADLGAYFAHADDLLDQTLHLGKKIELKCGAYSPEMLIESCLKNVFLNKDTDIKLEYEFNHSRYYFVDIKETLRVFNNIVFNAIEAMRGEGVIKFSVSDENGDSPSSEKRLSPYIKTSIYNNGPIINSKVIDKIFDPFVTHGKASGTGLGLAISKKIVEEHGGWIRVESNAEFGTRFIFTLPAAEAKSCFKGVLPTHSCMIGCHSRESGNPVHLSVMDSRFRGNDTHNKHTIVIIDDEDLPMTHAKTVLGKCDFLKDQYDIKCFKSGEEALPFIESNKDVKFVIVDYNLGAGKKNGVEIIKEIKKVSPSTKILMSSNFCPPEERLNALTAGANSFAPKPIAKGDIINIWQNFGI